MRHFNNQFYSTKNNNNNSDSNIFVFLAKLVGNPFRKFSHLSKFLETSDDSEIVDIKHFSQYLDRKAAKNAWASKSPLSL